MSTSTGFGVSPVPFPGRIIKLHEQDKTIVKAVQRRLNELGCGPVLVDGDFGSETRKAVKLFQARFPDSDGQPLKIDGEVGSITWAVLFGRESVPVTDAAEDPLLARVLETAVLQIGVRESPPGSNRGPQVDEYLITSGLDPARGRFAWCMAFIYWCFNQAAQGLGRTNPAIKTAGVLDHWNRAGRQGVPRLLAAQAVADPALIKPGTIFVISTGGGTGHTGLVERVVGGKLVTIEGNTNEGGSREGIGVFRRQSRKVVQINRGFIDYSGR